MRAALTVLLIALLLATAGEAGAFPSASHRKAEGPLSLDDYWQRVAETHQAVADLQEQGESLRRSRLGELADGWELITQVSMPDGTLVPLDHSELVAILRQDPPDPAAILGRLDALLSLHDRFPSGLFTPRDVETLEAILADARFQWAEAKPSPLAEWWQNLWRRFVGWLNRLLDKIGFGGVSVPAGPIMTWVLVAVLVIVLVFAGRGLLSGLVKDVELAADGLGAHEVLTSEAALQRADTLSRDGDYRRAVRYLYLSALLLLDERGLLRYDRSRTNREYLRNVSGSPALVQPLRAVIEIFDRVWYGFEPIDAPTYQEYVEQVDELRKQRP